MQTFTVNEFIKLELIDNETRILVNDEHFHQCKYLLLSIPLGSAKWERFESMDDIIYATNKGKAEQHALGLTPEEEFKGHCSNLQAWAENGYDYRLLDTKLSIPIINDVLISLLKKHHNEKAFVYPKDFWKQKLRRFFYDVVESLDNYMNSSLKNEYTYGKFSYLSKILFKTKDRFFEPEEIAGSVVLKEMYMHFLPQKKKADMIRRRNYWERKIYPKTPVVKVKAFAYYVGDKKFVYEYKAKKYAQAENLKYRRFLRSFRDATDYHTRQRLCISEMVGYLPYLYAKGKFTSEKNFSFIQLSDNIYIRDSEGRYWRTGC